MQNKAQRVRSRREHGGRQGQRGGEHVAAVRAGEGVRAAQSVFVPVKLWARHEKRGLDKMAAIAQRRHIGRYNPRDVQLPARRVQLQLGAKDDDGNIGGIGVRKQLGLKKKAMR